MLVLGFIAHMRISLLNFAIIGHVLVVGWMRSLGRSGNYLLFRLLLLPMVVVVIVNMVAMIARVCAFLLLLGVFLLRTSFLRAPLLGHPFHPLHWRQLLVLFSDLLLQHQTDFFALLPCTFFVLLAVHHELLRYQIACLRDPAMYQCCSS